LLDDEDDIDEYDEWLELHDVVIVLEDDEYE
jgi:hypothetical protein